MQGKYIALIPAYQPTELLVELVRKMARGFSIVLVDDGSGKACQALFERCAPYTGVLLRHDGNKGKGRALKTGLSYIIKHYSRDHIVVTFDADGQHRVEDALAVCRAAERNPGALILGSRALKANTPLRSRLGNAVTRLVYRLTTGVNIHDTQTGLRAFDFSLLPMLLSIPGERYEYEMNVLLECAREKIRICEEGIETVYMDHNASSHFHTLRDSARIYKEILKFTASSLTGFLVDYGLYSLFLLSGNLLLANIAARVVSASVNFTLNRKFVFQHKESAGKAAAKYALLAAAILLGNTAALAFLVNLCSAPPMLAKIVVEALFFGLSFLVQRLFIFRKRGASH